MAEIRNDDPFPLFDLDAPAAAALAGITPTVLRSWQRNGDLGAASTTSLEVGSATSHQVLRAAALAYFKSQKRNPRPATLARHVLPAYPFVIVMTKERLPIVVAVDALPQYLARPTTVMVFDARPTMERLRNHPASGGS